MANQIKYYTRARFPRGFWGKRTLKKMNGPQHALLPEWVFADFIIPDNIRVLDVGCGGGANIKRMLSMNPTITATGLDNSPLAMDMTHEENYRDIVDKRCLVLGGDALEMPLAKDAFDLVTAFEITCYWPSLATGVQELFRVLKPNGTCLIANEMDGTEKGVGDLERAADIRIYTIEDIKDRLSQAGFADIKARHDEERHFICLTATKP